MLLQRKKSRYIPWCAEALQSWVWHTQVQETYIAGGWYVHKRSSLKMSPRFGIL